MWQFESMFSINVIRLTETKSLTKFECSIDSLHSCTKVYRTIRQCCNTMPQWAVILYVIYKKKKLHVSWLLGEKYERPMLCGGSLTTAWCGLGLWLEDTAFPIWNVAENILNKQSRIADNGWSHSFAVGKGSVKVKLSLCFFKLSTTPWRRIGEWRHCSTQFWRGR